VDEGCLNPALVGAPKLLSVYLLDFD